MLRRFGLVVPAAVFVLASPLHADFLRGDANFDGRVNIADAIAQVRAIFAGDSLACLDAADADDDGKLTIDDVEGVLQFLFSGSGLPGPGTIVPGVDTTCDSLDCQAAPDLAPPIVLSEISYNPLSTQLTEFIEIHNRNHAPVSLAGYRFTDGIDFVFPDDAVLPADAFGLVLKNPTNSRWRTVTAPKFGPYQGKLDDGGERITLDNGCFSETVKYVDRFPWPIGPDGGSPTLERIDELLPAGDYHAWRTSTKSQGTPGAANSTAGLAPRPMVEGVAVDPPAPSSRDTVKVTLVLDAPAAELRHVVLNWEALAVSVTPVVAVEMTLTSGGPDEARYEAVIPPQPSQTLVRMNFQVDRADGRSVVLPHPADPGSFTSYFVQDFEVPAKLPILWLFPRRRTGLPGPVRTPSAAVVLEAEGSDSSRQPLVFDGADLRNSRQGQKLKFLKGNEYRGDRTLNIIPEEGGGGTGLAAPHMEHLGFLWFRKLGALAPRADWFRVVDTSAARHHSQRLVIEEVDERFLELNGLSPAGDLYKYVYQGNEKHTNLETGFRSLNDLLARLASPDPLIRSSTVRNELDLENVGLYSVVSVLISNWDGFHNNLYIYNELTPGARWKAIPWDLDQVFESSCISMPVTRPLTGDGCNARSDRRPLADPYHREADLHQAYLQRLRDSIAPQGPFNPDAVKASIDEVKALLLDDLSLLETFTGAAQPARRAQITGSYAPMRTYVDGRIAYLKRALGM